METAVEVNPDAICTAHPVHFRFQDVRETHDPAIAESYNACKIVVIEDFQFDGVDLSLWDAVRLDEKNDRDLKKIKHREITRPITNWPDHVIHRLTRDRELAGRIDAAVRSMDQQVETWLRLQFPDHMALETASTWRFTRTENEGYHLDIYSSHRRTLRAFFNLDYESRVWGFGLTVFDALRAVDRIPRQVLERAETRGYGELNAWLNHWVERQPASVIRFPRHCLWLAESQMVAHEIKSGNKMVGFTYFQPMRDLDDPSVTFANRVRDFMKANRLDGGPVQRLNRRLKRAALTRRRRAAAAVGKALRTLGLRRAV